MTDIEAATQGLYAAFATYPLKPAISVCPDCGLEKAEKALRRRKLERIRWRDFGVYPAKAITTFGDIDDFKHFLPRILELYHIDHAGSPYDVAMLFEKLDYAKWTDWPDTETASIRRFIEAWLADLRRIGIKSREEPWELEELESALRDARLDISGAVS